MTWSHFFADKPYLRIGHARQHFLRSHSIKRGYAWIKKNCYLKRLIFSIHIVTVSLKTTGNSSGGSLRLRPRAAVNRTSVMRSRLGYSQLNRRPDSIINR